MVVLVKSPTSRSLEAIRERGFAPWVVEYYNSFSRKRVDLFGAWDIMAVGNGEVLLVQTTSGSNVSARVRKIADNAFTPLLREAGVRLEVHGWRQVKRKWKNGNTRLEWACRTVDVS